MRLHALIAAAAGVVTLAVASSAWAAPGITPVPPTQGSWWNAASPTPTYHVTGATPAEPITLSAEANGAPTPVSPATLTADGDVTLTAFPDYGIGTLTASQTSGSTPVAVQVDRIPPTLTSWNISPAANANGWWNTPPTLSPVCADADHPSTCAPVAWNPLTMSPSGPLAVVDQAGNPSPAVAYGPIKFDATPPSAAGGLPLEPGNNSVVATQPIFQWTPGVDAESGVDKYLLQVRVVDPGAPSAPFQTVATVADTGGSGNYSATSSTKLPEQREIQWQVVTVDKAGNSGTSSPPRVFTIDSTIPPGPTITGGPLGPTRVTTPTFSWSGTESSFQWSLTAAGAASPLRTGGGQGVRQVTLGPLADGDYTFRVHQVTPAGQPGADASRSFKVMTVSPPAPTITLRPPPGASGPVTFGWSTVPGAYSRWQVLGTGGAIVAGPNDTPQSTVVVPALAAGAYTFQVLQVDPAGNVSGTTSEAFTTSEPRRTTNTGLLASLPRQNARRLRPLPGRTVPTRSPVLRWPRGPRGTMLYNVQVFQVTGKRRGVQTTLRKVVSAFPRGLQWRAPASRLRAGTCYVWRVWPYTGRQFTAQPLGISNFCVASKKVLARKAALKRAKRAGTRARR